MILEKTKELKKKYGEIAELMPQWWILKDKDELFFERLTGMLDLHALCSRVLDFGDMGKMHKGLCQRVAGINPVFVLKALRDLAKFVSNDKIILELKDAITSAEALCKKVCKQRMFLLFRGGFKTSIITEAHSIQLSLIDPNIRILICGGNMGNACKILKSIKSQFMYNEKFRYLYNEYCPPMNRNRTVEFGTQESFTVPNRFIFRREGTVDAAGLETRKTGNHWDILKKDDLVNEANCTSKEMLDKADDFNKYSLSLFDNPADPCQDYIGTRYHVDDLYGKMEERNLDDWGNVHYTTYDGYRWEPKIKKVAA